jgi:hypothetical protein
LAGNEAQPVRPEPVEGRSIFFPDITEFAAGEHPRANDLSLPPLLNPACHCEPTVLSKCKNRSLSVDCNCECYLCAIPDETSDRGNLIFFLSLADITEFALRKSRV